MTETLLPPRRRIPVPARRPNWRRRLITLAVVVVAAVIVGALEFSPLVGVRTIRVSGTSQLTEQQVLDAAAIKRGTPLLRLDRQAIITRVSKLSDVRSVRVTTSLPSTVHVVVTERNAVAYLAVDSKFRLYDGADVGFRLVAKPPAGLPRLDVDPTSPAGAAATTVAASLPITVSRKVVTISVPSTESVTLTLADGRVVLWGGTDRYADKARLLPVLLKQPGQYFDLSDPDVVISRPSS